MSTDLMALNAALPEPLAEWVLAAQQAERRRAARDIHDRLGYWLSLAHVELERYELQLYRDLGGAGEHLAAGRQAIAEGLAEIRRMVTELRESSAVGCVEKALGIVADLTAPASSRVKIVVHGDEQQLPGNVRSELFLVLREAMRNAFAHADPASVTVLVDIKTTRVLAEVVDDGRGFDPERAAQGGGIASMRERIELLGGSISITSEPRHGCSVRIQLARSGSIRRRSAP